MTSLINETRLDIDSTRTKSVKYENFWKEHNASFIDLSLFSQHKKIFLEIGAGTGWFFLEMAKNNPDTLFIAIERDRMRGNRLLHRTKKAGLNNVKSYRGNIVPAFINGILENSLDRIYILYPCPWPKMSQRRNRWYLHPVMPHLVNCLKPDGLLIWASDQQSYIVEAEYVCNKKYNFKTVEQGELRANPYNNLAEFPSGRTKFEASFLELNQKCYELVVQKRKCLT